MRQSEMVQLVRRSGVVLLVGMIFCLGTAQTAEAQEGRSGRPRLAPEKQAAAWEIEAKAVGHALGVDKAGITKLVTVYRAARKSQGEAMTKLREESGGGGFGNFEAFISLSESMTTCAGATCSNRARARRMPIS